ncbi:hypothetical protein RDn1_354 [Candidatus Termititenax dinenymphae]|uniref:Uncharacterized protein n=1 Tax=Candidatus Termititenax dinenymphae TaxID=2218523 RepID=A0A388TNI9_9BACT|nr:hypothetical protein RDn1_354 [Candidatus Termititenax dinenymphae]
MRFLHTAGVGVNTTDQYRASLANLKNKITRVFYGDEKDAPNPYEQLAHKISITDESYSENVVGGIGGRLDVHGEGDNNFASSLYCGRLEYLYFTLVFCVVGFVLLMPTAFIFAPCFFSSLNLCLPAD